MVIDLQSTAEKSPNTRNLHHVRRRYAGCLCSDAADCGDAGLSLLTFCNLPSYLVFNKGHLAPPESHGMGFIT